MVKKLPNKAELRAALEQETNRYLKSGGKVEQVPQGASGTDPEKAQSFYSGALFSQPPSPRTFVPEVVAAIEKRRGQLKSKGRPVRKRSRLPNPRRKVVYDDFGEPIRKVWVDE
jgi:hypothetical protein